MAKRVKQTESESADEETANARPAPPELPEATRRLQNMSLAEVIEAELLRHMVRGTLRKPRGFRRS